MLRNAMQLLHESERVVQVLQDMATEEFVYRVRPKRQRLPPARIEIGYDIDAGQLSRIEIEPTGTNVAAAAQMQPPRAVS